MTPGEIRSQAVANVDARHGYTYEFSGSPAAHLQEYDEEERRLTNPCPTCWGTGCEEGCGVCTEAYRGPNSHKVCVACHGFGSVS